jgi:hypothetical protein
MKQSLESNQNVQNMNYSILRRAIAMSADTQTYANSATIALVSHAERLCLNVHHRRIHMLLQEAHRMFITD